ncbi:MAG: HAD family hydrolase [Gemmataceae bacterium]
MNPPVLLFDIDGTLIRGGGAGHAALRHALRELHGFTGDTTAVEFRGRTDPGIIRDLLALAGVESTPHHHDRMAAAYLAALPLTLRERGGVLLPGVVALLEALAGRAALGLLTGNSRAGAAHKLGHFGIGHHFAFGGFGDVHPDRDDVARAALADAVRHLGGVDPERVWVIGDTPADVRCGRAIGARVAAVLTGWHDREELEASAPDVLLDDLSDTPRLLALWS